MLTNLFPEVRESEGRRFRFFLILAGLLFASQSVAMTVCESLLLSRLGIQALPYSVLAASALTLVSSYVYTRWVGGRRHEDSLLILLGLAMVIILGTIPFVLAERKPFYVVIFAFHFVTFTIFAGHLQALAGDYFDTLACKRILPLIGVGATSGEIIGGLSASAVTRYLPIEALLFLWVVFLGGAAAHTWLHRRQLKIWNPSSQVKRPGQADTGSETSVLELLKKDRLNLNLTFMVCTMIFTMSMVQYVVSDVFVSSFPDENRLASFLGIFVACTNGFELLVASKITPRLLKRFGVATCNTLHSAGAVITLGILWNSYALVPAILAWMNRKTFHDALAGPVRRLVFNAVGVRERVRLMAFIDGVAGSAARAGASALIFLLQGSLNAKFFVIPGLIFAAFYLLSSVLVGRSYFQALVSQIARDRLLGGDTSKPLDEQLPVLWSESLRDPSGKNLAQLALWLDEAGYEETLLASLEQQPEDVQIAVVKQLGSRCPDHSLKSESARVRMAAAQSIWPDASRLKKLTEDSDPSIRSLAVAATGGEIEAETELTIRYRHKDHLAPVIAALNSNDEDLVKAALERLSGENCIELAQVFALASHPSQEVVEAAVSSLAGWSDPMASVQLARCLKAPEARTRQSAANALARQGSRVIPHLKTYFRAERLAVAEAAYDAFQDWEDDLSRQVLGGELRVWVRSAWRNLVLSQNLAPFQQPHLRLLKIALADRADRCQRLAFKVLALLENDQVVGSVVNSLRFSDGAKRAAALEVLSNLGDREAAGLLVLLTEPSPLEERLKQALSDSPTLAALPHSEIEIVALCAQSPGRFVARGAAVANGSKLNFLELRMLCLRDSELFSSLTLEETEQIARLVTEERFAAGESILDGSPRLFFAVGKASDDVLGLLQTLDEGPPDTVVAEENRQFLTLARSELLSLVKQQPAVSFPIIGLLTQRLKENEKRLADVTQA